MESLRQVFIRNLKYYRKQKGLRQIDLALELDKNTNYINSIENSKYFPSPETIEQIAKVLEIEPVQLFAQNNENTKDIKIDASELTEQLYYKLKIDLYDFLKKDISEYFSNQKDGRS